MLEVVAGFIVSAVSLLATVALQVRVLKGRKARGRETVEERISSLVQALSGASKAIGDIEQEVAQRKELLERLRADAEKYQQLAALKEEEVAAVVQVVRGAVGEEGRRSFWRSTALSAGFFLAGSAVTVGVGLIVGA